MGTEKKVYKTCNLLGISEDERIRAIRKGSGYEITPYIIVQYILKDFKPDLNWMKGCATP